MIQFPGYGHVVSVQFVGGGASCGQAKAWACIVGLVTMLGQEVDPCQDFATDIDFLSKTHS